MADLKRFLVPWIDQVKPYGTERHLGCLVPTGIEADVC